MSEMELLARLARAETALSEIVLSGDEVADMAASFIAARDVRSLRNYGNNIASIARAALAPLADGAAVTPSRGKERT